MAETPADIVNVSIDAGVVTARVVGGNIEEREATAILDAVRHSIDVAGPGLRAIVLDFGDVRFINSSGLAACIEIRNAADPLGAKTILYRPREDVERLFAMVKVDRLFTPAKDEKELAVALG